MTSAFLQRWFTALGIGNVLFGIVLTLGAFPATDAPAMALLRLQNAVLASAPLTQTTRFTIGVLGGVSIGFGILLWGTSTLAMRTGDRALARWLAAGVLGWYVPDSIASMLTGFGANAVINTVLLTAFMVPLLASGLLLRQPNRA